ncbi:MAG: hypothetical protein F6K30_19025 [Cyanothece sp. SIO2G6]|nr:hypothetical protein [Cyanothece sp. SIO2G6]
MAVNWELLKGQYLKGNRASQLGNLALNLMRLHVLARQGGDDVVAQHLVRESQFFVEWMVPTINLDTEISSATELLDLQRSLSCWKLNWAERWANESEREQVAVMAQEWCDRLQQQCDALAS